MRKFFWATGMSVAALIATEASASVTICSGNCAPFDTNVLMNGNDTAQPTQSGSAGGATVLFSSTMDSLVAPSNGQARIEASDGALNQLSFSLLGGYTFSSAVFNLFNASNAGTSVTISYFDPNLMSMANQTFDLSANGQNFFGFSGDAGETFSGLTFQFNDGAIADLRQLRLGGVASTTIPAVPEPGTWALLVLGLGAVGSSLRRRTGEQAFS